MPNENRKKKPSIRGDSKLLVDGTIELKRASYPITEMALVSLGKGKNYICIKILINCIKKKHRDVLKREIDSRVAAKAEIKRILDQAERKEQLRVLFENDASKNPFHDVEHEFELFISSDSFLLSDTIPHQEADYLNISTSIAEEQFDIEGLYTFNKKKDNSYVNNNHAKDGIRTESAKQPGIYALLFSRKYNEIAWIPCAMLDMQTFTPF